MKPRAENQDHFAWDNSNVLDEVVGELDIHAGNPDSDHPGDKWWSEVKLIAILGHKGQLMLNKSYKLQKG